MGVCRRRRLTVCNLAFCCHHFLQDVTEHELLPVFKQLNVLKWQITDNSAADIFTSKQCGFMGYELAVFAEQISISYSSDCRESDS